MIAPRILLLTDFSDLSKIAMKFAIKMTAPMKGEFTILSVVRFDGIPQANLKMKQIEKSMKQVVEDEGRQLVEELKQEIKGDYQIEFKAITAHTVAEMVKNYIKKHKIEMVVMGSHGASALKKMFLGGTTVSVIDSCPVPVLSIPQYAVYKNLDRIVYASDLKDVKKELNLVVRFAKYYGSTIHMIYVTPAMDKKTETSRLQVEGIIKEMGYDKLKFEIILDNHVPTAIDKYIKNIKADLLATFTHKLSLEEKLFAKSVTRTLAYLGSIPLLAIKRK